jgi:hypothetical protein
MVSEEYTAKAFECYRLAQKAVNPDARRALLEVAIRWLELAAQRHRLNRTFALPQEHIERS